MKWRLYIEKEGELRPTNLEFTGLRSWAMRKARKHMKNIDMKWDLKPWDEQEREIAKGRMEFDEFRTECDAVLYGGEK